MLSAYNFLQLQSLIAEMYRGRRVDVRPFGYVFDFDIIADGTEGVSTNKIIGNADFIVCSMSASNQDGLSDGSGRTLQIIDSGSEERFFDTPAPLLLVCSGPYNERGLSYPRRVAGNSLLTATIAVPATTGAMPVTQLYLNGVNVYVYSN